MDLSPAEWTFFAVAVDLFCRVCGLFEAEYPNLSQNLFIIDYYKEMVSYSFSNMI